MLLAALVGMLAFISRQDRRARAALEEAEREPPGPPAAVLLLLLMPMLGGCLASTGPYTLGDDGPRVLDRHFTPRPGTGGLVFDQDLTVSGLHVHDSLELAQLDGEKSAQRLHCPAYRIELSAPPKEDLSTE